LISELSYEGGAEGEDIPPPALKVVPRERSLILIRRLTEAGEAGYWDQEKDMVVGPNDITLDLSTISTFAKHQSRSFTITFVGYLASRPMLGT
jgi:hypothetical protein